MGSFDSYEEGRVAFEEGKDITECPHELTKSQRVVWKAGFKAAQRDYEAQKVQEEWRAFACLCPWHDDEKCKALIGTEHDACSETNCAPLYFRTCQG